MTPENAHTVLAAHGARHVIEALRDNPDGPIQEITSRHALGVDYEVVIGDAGLGDHGRARVVWSRSVHFGQSDRNVAGGSDFVMAARASDKVAQACLVLLKGGMS